MTDVFIAGIGQSRFGRLPERSYASLANEAVRAALEDAGLGAADIDAVYVGTVFAPGGTTHRMLRSLGLAGVPALTVESACASGSSALALAADDVRIGRHRNVLALGVERMASTFEGPIPPEPTDVEGSAGLAMPAMYALMAARYLHEHDRPVDDIARVAVKNRRHGLDNPDAPFGRSHTVEEVLASRPIADPLTLLQCCPQADGAAAAVVTSAPTAPADAPRIAALATTTGRAWDDSTSTIWSTETVHRTATMAYEQAGIGPDDVDVVEVHDAFTIGEVVTCEALGLADPGTYPDLVRDGTVALGGRLPVNPSGGLLARGHPLGATGLAQLAELVTQLRGKAGARQVDGARVALMETMGGGAAGVDGNACVVAMLRAPSSKGAPA